ncbi:HAMP domain-containing histidine kinase [Glaciecola sp. MH2013]|uniref:sensor histidine kinase n=1 Tax=Glaciecola sp. MH2013 TaxID=2785524 RepID=UPI0018A05968|nr:HAMP domain-containing sensor histidine kinase [Glaciecola sp. MH2013]MBF7074208.1 HAMP domain-containing histidine kinase [Glaciecola sp. MH2013]
MTLILGETKTVNAKSVTAKKLNLSLSSFIFLVVGAFLVCLAGAQLFFISYIEEKVNEEVSAKSTLLSNRAIEILSVNKTFDIAAIPQRFSESSSLPNTITMKEKKLRFDVSKNEAREDLERTLKDLKASRQGQNEILQDLEKQEPDDLAKEMDALQDRAAELSDGWEIRADKITIFPTNKQTRQLRIENNDRNSFSFRLPNSSLPSVEIIEFSENESLVRGYFQWLAVATLILLGVGLLFAFWLSRHVSRPLKELAGGFSALSAGELGKQIKPSGVKEVQNTLSQFNATSERLSQLQALANKYEQQKQLAELGEVSRGLAHSLRNPLNTIGLALEQMSQPSLQENERAQIAEQARVKISVLDRMIRSLLALTTSGVNRKQKVNVNQAIEDAVLQASMCGAKNISISAEQQAFVIGSEVEITALIHSLVTNAVEACSSNHDLEAKIEVRLFQSNNATMICVVDNGTGLSEAIIGSLFQPHTTTKSEGAGMGLYIAKRILSSHYAGDLTLMNNAERGCTATITIGELSGV